MFRRLQESERAGMTNTPQTRERWRGFPTRKKGAKHQKYDAACAACHWNFVPMALGTWGGQGLDGSKVLARVLKRCAGWQEGNLRGHALGWTLFSCGRCGSYSSPKTSCRDKTQTKRSAQMQAGETLYHHAWPWQSRLATALGKAQIGHAFKGG